MQECDIKSSRLCNYFVFVRFLNKGERDTAWSQWDVDDLLKNKGERDTAWSQGDVDDLLKNKGERDTAWSQWDVDDLLKNVLSYFDK